MGGLASPEMLLPSGCLTSLGLQSINNSCHSFSLPGSKPSGVQLAFAQLFTGAIPPPAMPWLCRWPWGTRARLGPLGQWGWGGVRVLHRELRHGNMFYASFRCQLHSLNYVGAIRVVHLAAQDVGVVAVVLGEENVVGRKLERHGRIHEHRNACALQSSVRDAIQREKDGVWCTKAGEATPCVHAQANGALIKSNHADYAPLGLPFDLCQPSITTTMPWRMCIKRPWALWDAFRVL